ncbi:hypothetical protein AVEN_250956-1 [Araneus ventricosus]|uniref:C2H2-type domain-containing protein n=1 Tax=Araneus ventricosus TaxID=182803 RepID=A0A4Y2P3M2_ARAVE|nr:hypothetical protein AVEN_250956-1 [Araneus ventricosus]
MPTAPVSSQVASTGAAVLPRNVKRLKHPQPLKAVVTDGSLDCQFCEYRAPSAKALRVHLIQVHRIQEQQRHRPTSQDPGLPILSDRHPHLLCLFRIPLDRVWMKLENLSPMARQKTSRRRITLISWLTLTVSLPFLGLSPLKVVRTQR